MSVCMKIRRDPLKFNVYNTSRYYSKSQIRLASTSQIRLASTSQIRLASTSQITSSSSDKTDNVRSIAVIGAGLSGLTHALYLARGLLKKNKGKEFRIVVYESSDRVGGWVKSDRLRIKGNEDETRNALIESGPRSIRMAGLGGLSMMELIATLNLGDQLISVPKTTPSAYQRMIKYGGRYHILPHSPLSLFYSFLDKNHLIHKVQLEELLNAFKMEIRKPIKSKFPDESVEEFFTRMLSPKDRKGNLINKENSIPPSLIEYVLSAMLHGIYAADASQLSMRSVFPQIYHPALALDRPKNTWLPFPFDTRVKPYFLLAEEGEEWAKTELAKTKMRSNEITYFKRVLGKEIVDMAEKTSVVSFHNGIQTLTDAIAQECKERGVEFKMKSEIDQIKLQEKGGKAVIQLKDQSKQIFDRVISSIPSKTLEPLLSDTKLPHLKANPSATVCVVNFAFPPEIIAKTPAAFGYLIPRASAKENDNALGHLGTVFDSEAVPGQDDYTKYTMMFGGPFWKPGYAIYDLYQESKGDWNKFEQDAIKLAILTIQGGIQKSDLQFDQQLITKDLIKKVSLQKDCIPTYSPGHLERMNDLHESLRENKNMPLSVLGASYTGVSLNDCVLNARRSALRIILAEEYDEEKNLTGLEDLLAV